MIFPYYPEIHLNTHFSAILSIFIVKKIKNRSFLSRANALAAAQLYADDIQNLLEIDIQDRIHSTLKFLLEK